MIEEARRIAAGLLERGGRAGDARLVAAGAADDFGEVRVALAALQRGHARSALLERALRCYADPTFWDDEMPEASLAFHDRGAIARSALAGRELFAQHRD
jgi:hypothetical protein